MANRKRSPTKSAARPTPENPPKTPQPDLGKNELNVHIKPGGRADELGKKLREMPKDTPEAIKALGYSTFTLTIAVEDLEDMVILIDDRMELLKHTRRAIEYQQTAANEMIKVTKRMLHLEEAKNVRDSDLPK